MSYSVTASAMMPAAAAHDAADSDADTQQQQQQQQLRESVLDAVIKHHHLNNKNDGSNNNNTAAAAAADAFMEAWIKVPDLVLEESDPVRFLLMTASSSNSNSNNNIPDQYDIDDAARKLIRWWDNRRALFGPRAFLLPLTQTGRGALNKADVAVLRTGYLSILPPSSTTDDGDDNDTTTTNNHNGRTVIFFDTSRCGGNTDTNRHNRSRCLFYVLHVAALQHNNKPVVFVRYASTPHYDKVRFRKFLSLISCMPMKLETLVSVYAPPPGATRMFKRTIVPVLGELMVQQFPGMVHTIIGTSSNDIYENGMKQLGFYNKRGLPECLGGFWILDDHSAWMTRRLDQELRSEAAARGHHKEEDHHHHEDDDDGYDDAHAEKKKQAATADAKAATPSPTMGESTTSTGPPAESTDRFANLTKKLREIKRRRDAEYSRKRRSQKRTDEKGLQLSCSFQTKLNRNLRNENQRLTKLLADARAVVMQQNALAAATAVPGVPPALPRLGTRTSAPLNVLPPTTESTAAAAVETQTFPVAAATTLPPTSSSSSLLLQALQQLKEVEKAKARLIAAQKQQERTALVSDLVLQEVEKACLKAQQEKTALIVDLALKLATAQQHQQQPSADQLLLNGLLLQEQQPPSATIMEALCAARLSGAAFAAAEMPPPPLTTDPLQQLLAASWITTTAATVADPPLQPPQTDSLPQDLSSLQDQLNESKKKTAILKLLLATRGGGSLL